jgi:hypothetical protein
MSPPRSRAALVLAAVLIGALGCAQGASASDAAEVVRATPGVLAYWPLDEPTGAIVTDALGGLTGTVSGTPVLGAATARSDDRGAAIGLTGTSAVSLGSSPPLSGDLSLEAWVSVQTGATGTRYVLSKGNASAGVHVLLESADRVLFRVGTGSGATTTTGPGLPSGTWHQLVATLAGRTATLYVDGRPAASTSLPRTPVASTSALSLGRYSASATGYWRGRVDELSVYGRALTDDEVAGHYAAVADVAPPATALTAAPAPLVNRDGATVAFTASKSQSTFTCRLDTGPWTACDGSASYSGIAEGTHQVAVLATDRYGIVARAAATATWQVDLTPPETLMLASAPVAGVTRASFASEPGASFECRDGSDAWDACTSPVAAPTGTVLSVRARDRAGNVDPSPATVTFAAAADDGAEQYVGSAASFAVAGARSTAGVECRIDGGAWSPCPAPLTFAGTGYGNHELAVRDQRLPGVASAPSLTWDVALPVPRLIAPSFPSLLTFASRRAQRRTKAARAPRLLFLSNVDATATATLSRRGRRLAAWSLGVHRGSNTMAFPIGRLRKLRPGRHTVTVRPTNAAGVGRTLSVRFDVVQLRRR